jgi:hypothetical protein
MNARSAGVESIEPCAPEVIVVSGALESST